MPIEFVKGLGVKDKGDGISIPYYDESGKVAAERLRMGKRLFKWKKEIDKLNVEINYSQKIFRNS